MLTTNKIKLQPSKSRQLGYGLLILITLGFVVLLGMFVVYYPWSNPPLWQIERITSVKFPRNARVLGSCGRWFMEIDIWAKIEIDKSYVSSFIKSLPTSSQASDISRAGLLNTKILNWWDPKTVKKPQFIFFQKHSNRHYRIIIDTDDPYKAIIYLRYFMD